MTTSKRLAKIRTLKIDKDCVISSDLMQDWIRLVVIPTCTAYGVTVLSVATCPSPRKGFHVYAEISPPIHAELAWRLQFLLGDDCRRVSLNRARLRAGFSAWNKLFEGINPRVRTVHTLTRVIVGRRFPSLAVHNIARAQAGDNQRTCVYCLAKNTP
jgi:hypothetical protein